ncbi:hypothetical protein [Croceiramulus getboli]|nr:hypothetical protein P8624_08895 [Flavobacteriaceae bacterium YJPT1-3]
MKTTKQLLLILLTLAWVHTGHAQKATVKSVKLNATSMNKMKVKSSTGCQQISTRIVTGLLRNSVTRSLKVKLDRDDSYVTLMGNTQRFTIPEKEVQGPARKWKYYVKDLNSFKSWITFDDKRKQFYLFIEFEGNGSEIKGECPGCLRRFRDSRAPDLNWEGKRVAKIHLTPIPYDNSVAFEVDKVELEGKFDLNGPTEFFLPSLVKFFENRIKDGIEKQARAILNSPENKKAMADGMRGTLSMLGLTRVSSVEITDRNLYVCN